MFLSLSAVRPIVLPIVLVSMLGLSACGSLKKLGSLGEYFDAEFDSTTPRDFITLNDVSKLVMGMSQSQVKNRLGPPLNVTKNDENRFEYLFRSVRGERLELVPYYVKFVDGKVRDYGIAEDTSKPAPVIVSELLNLAPMAQPDETSIPVKPVLASEIGLQPVSLNEEMAMLVNAWANAWSMQDFATYMAFYSESFQPTDRSGRAGKKSWGEAKKSSLAGKDEISVDVSDFRVKQLAPNRVQVVFLQKYASKTLKEQGYKTLVFTKQGADWKITLEKFKRGKSKR